MTTWTHKLTGGRVQLLVGVVVNRRVQLVVGVAISGRVLTLSSLMRSKS